MASPVDERFILETEKKLKAKLPSDYAKRLMRDNGGEIRTPPDAWVLYPIFDSSDKKRIKRTCNDIVSETRNAQQWARFPKDAIAIGSNGSGDQLVLLRNEHSQEIIADAVYWWDHETGKLTLVASRFDDLASS